MTDLTDFLRIARRLRLLRAPALIAAGVMAQGDVDGYARFRANPVGFLAGADPSVQQRLWQLITPQAFAATACTVAAGIDKVIAP